ncbi:MAG: hypothetical protein IPK94_06665 [Saprospiraceae bacterium]|nr:hypothetical protein [Saprospiraceae bacterium]
MYMVFIKGFVQSVSGQNKHYKQFTLAARIFFSILMADVIILLFMGPVTSIEVFHFIRPVFMIFYAYALYVLITYFDRVETSLYLQVALFCSLVFCIPQQNNFLSSKRQYYGQASCENIR